MPAELSPQMNAKASSKEAPVYTTGNGRPMPCPYATQRVGKFGPLLLQDTHFIEQMAHFDREIIPRRVVHAKGGGAWGEFECTDDVSDLTCASFLQKGKKSKCVTRFSTVAMEQGSPDTNRDPRGFATKIWTDEGVMDWVFNNTPVFFIRDPMKFIYFIHSQKRNPKTNLRDHNMFWDYFCNNPESLHQVMTLFSDRGTPASWRHMHAYSGHVYKWVKQDGSWVYVQIHVKADGGFKALTNDEAVKVGGQNPDYNQQDLYEAIDTGKYPTWTCYVQTMTPEQAEKQPYNIFDLTKVWPQGDFPLRRFGKLTLNKNCENYFAEMEQVAFSPANVVPGWDVSADPVLQSRLFSYDDTHRHRLGTNYKQIPVNCPYASHTPYQRDGAMVVDGNSGRDYMYPSTWEPVSYKPTPQVDEKHEKWVGHATAFNWTVEDDYDYEQPRGMWKVLGEQGQKNFVYNVASHVMAAKKEVQDRVCHEYFAHINPQLGKDIEKKIAELSK